MKIGYIRIRKGGPSAKQQKEALQQAGVKDVSMTGNCYIDQPKKKTHSLRSSDLPERQDMFNALRKGDTIVVTDLATLAVSEWDWLDCVSAASKAGANVQILEPPRLLAWNRDVQLIVSELTETATAVFEALRKEQTAPARRARIMQGALGGRPVSVIDKYGKDKFDQAELLWADPKGGTKDQIAATTGIPKSTLSRYLGSLTKARETTDTEDTLEKPESTD